MSENRRLEEWKNAYEKNQYSNRNELSKREDEIYEREHTSDTPANNHVSYSYQVVVNDTVQYVGFWRRVFAFVIDNVILMLLLNILNIDNLIIQLFICSLYYAFLTCSPLKGTLGKAAIGAQVVDKDGNQVSFLRATCRFFTMLLSGVLFFFGFIMIGFHAQKKGLHDQICGTMVINKK